MHTILGAGGTIGNALVPILLEQGATVQLVARQPAEIPGTLTRRADLTDAGQALEAIRGSTVAYLLVGLAYSSKVWQSRWPLIMTNVIAACKASGVRLVFFDNVYMYGAVSSPMTEESPFAPTSAKGKVRAAIATQLLDAIRTGAITALIARSADFYGPGATKSSIPNMLVFDNLRNGKTAQWLVNANVPHSYTYVPDAARALFLLAANDSAFGQTWHLPTHAGPPTGRTFMRLAAQAFGAADRQMILRKWMLRAFGLVNGDVREAYEMLYQNDRPYIFDASKFQRAFATLPTSYEDGIIRTAQWYRDRASASLPAPASRS